MKFNRQQLGLYLEMEEFYLITSSDDGDDLRSIRSLMGGLVRKARKVITDDMDTRQKIHQLLQLMYGDWGFYCDPNDYFQVEHLYLGYVLREKKGMPVSLGCIVLYLADKLKLPIYPVNFPSQLILRADVDGETAFIDPWNGEYISQPKLQMLYEGALGFGAKLTVDELAVANERAICERFAQLAKNALIREEHNEAAFKYIEHRLKMQEINSQYQQGKLEVDPYDVRDRGLVLAQMGAYHAAINDLKYFIQQCPDDPTAFLLHSQIDELQQEFYGLH